MAGTEATRATLSRGRSVREVQEFGDLYGSWLLLPGGSPPATSAFG
jgi:hypothetical protein